MGLDSYYFEAAGFKPAVRVLAHVHEWRDYRGDVAEVSTFCSARCLRMFLRKRDMMLGYDGMSIAVEVPAPAACEHCGVAL